MSLCYHHAITPCVVDSRSVIDALCRAQGDGDFVVYGREPFWRIALGIAVEILITADGVQVTGPDSTRRLVLEDKPFVQLGRLLDELPVEGWRAFGTIAFEAGQLEHRGKLIRSGRPIAHVILPAIEVGLRPGWLEVRATDPAALREVQVRALAAVAPQELEGAPFNVRTHGEAAYKDAVQTVVDAIRDRAVEKVIASRRGELSAPVDIIATFLRGMRSNTPYRAYCVRLGGREAAGFSPERVCEVVTDGEVLTQPLAGTRARTGEREVDEDARRDLLADAKEVFEHAISVRLAVEELSSFCDPTTVAVRRFMDVKERGTVQHLASLVGGHLAAHRTRWEAMAALFPAITASGVSKVNSLEWIERVEAEPRGLYAGSVLTADQGGALDAALVLRTVFQEQGRAWLQAGAGIVERSSPDFEWEETCHKMESVARYLVSPARPRSPWRGEGSRIRTGRAGA